MCLPELQHVKATLHVCEENLVETFSRLMRCLLWSIECSYMHFVLLEITMKTKGGDVTHGLYQTEVMLRFATILRQRSFIDMALAVYIEEPTPRCMLMEQAD